MPGEQAALNLWDPGKGRARLVRPRDRCVSPRPVKEPVFKRNRCRGAPEVALWPPHACAATSLCTKKKKMWVCTK